MPNESEGNRFVYRSVTVRRDKQGKIVDRTSGEANELAKSPKSIRVIASNSKTHREALKRLVDR